MCWRLASTLKRSVALFNILLAGVICTPREGWYLTLSCWPLGNLNRVSIMKLVFLHLLSELVPKVYSRRLLRRFTTIFFFRKDLRRLMLPCFVPRGRKALPGL